MNNLSPHVWNAELEGRIYPITFLALDWLDTMAQVEQIRQHPQRINHEWLRACELFSREDPQLFLQMLKRRGS